MKASTAVVLGALGLLIGLTIGSSGTYLLTGTRTAKPGLADRRRGHGAGQEASGKDGRRAPEDSAAPAPTASAFFGAAQPRLVRLFVTGEKDLPFVGANAVAALRSPQAQGPVLAAWALFRTSNEQRYQAFAKSGWGGSGHPFNDRRWHCYWGGACSLRRDGQAPQGVAELIAELHQDLLGLAREKGATVGQDRLFKEGATFREHPNGIDLIKNPWAGFEFHYLAGKSQGRVHVRIDFQGASWVAAGRPGELYYYETTVEEWVY
jgi:hypothetical protein